MLIGSVGTGKTTLVQKYLRDNASDTLLSCTINTSYYTDANALQRQLEQPLDKVLHTCRVSESTVVAKSDWRFPLAWTQAETTT